uniref:Integrase catalytic domain-containing protein n=1 Tax=Nicotiana tabacum TaxID=4097 RepID=A0A1S4BI34_TOBAC|nr:PREDICTED: uncharacterized protein LOC107808515 [Nicotiana tabacum]
MEHLRKVFQVLRENELYIKRDKCEFAQSNVHFLGHVISNGKLRMDEDKVRAIQEREAPIKVNELRSFLGLVNYYHRFISGYSAKVAPLTELLKKNKTWVWTEHCQKAFEGPKAAVTEESVLALPNFANTFEVHTDASDFAIGSVLMQDKHPIAFESCKLNETERRYMVQEKEMIAIVHCLHLSCLSADKVEQQQPRGLLEPLLVAERPWESVTMDFITCLPKFDGYGTIMVVVDIFSKYATFMPASPGCTAKEAAKLFFKNVVKYWGLPRHIISYRDPRSTRNFWRELFNILGTELHFSTSFHPQTDGQTERVNALLECYLRHYISAYQKDWARLLDIAQFSYNLQRSESTGRTLFELVTGQQPQTPHLLPVAFEGKSLGTYHMAKG